ncbi:MAG: DUF721 domain-containing protein [Planctomycetota bacterium]
MGDSDPELSEEEKWDLASIKQRPSRYNAKKMGTVVRRLMTQRGYGQTELNEALHAYWEQCAGPQLAGVTKPGKISRGVLIVHAANSAALQELTFEKRRILRELEKCAPELKIKDIKAKVGK